LFCVAVVSGVVVYAPSMRKQKFGAYRSDRPRVVRWLDLHNLAGILLVMWTLVVGFTGVINTWADLVLKMWQYGQLAEMTTQYRGRMLPAHPSSVQDAAQVWSARLDGRLPDEALTNIRVWNDVIKQGPLIWCGDVLLIGTSKGEIVGLAASSGHILWRESVPGAERIADMALIDGTHLLIVDERRQIKSIDLKDKLTAS